MAEPAFDSIVHLLAAASTAIGVVSKKERNTKGSGFNFRGIDTVVNATSPEFRERGIIVVPESIDRTYEQIEVGAEKTDNSGSKYRTVMGHVMLRVRYTFHGPAGDSIVATVDSEAFDSGDKATAKAMSVALRTALLQVLMLPTDEVDPDATSYERAPKASSGSPAPRSAPKASAGGDSGKRASEKQVAAVFGKAKTLKWDDEYLLGTIKRNFKVDHPGDLTPSACSKLLNYLEEKIKAQAVVETGDGSTPADEGYAPDMGDGSDIPF